MPDYILRLKDDDGAIAAMVTAIESVPTLKILDKTPVMMLVRGERSVIDALPGIGDWDVFEQKRIPLPSVRPKLKPPSP